MNFSQYQKGIQRVTNLVVDSPCSFLQMIRKKTISKHVFSIFYQTSALDVSAHKSYRPLTTLKTIITVFEKFEFIFFFLFQCVGDIYKLA